MEHGDVDLVLMGLAHHDVRKPRTYIARCWQENLTGQRTTFLAFFHGNFAGWGHLVYTSSYLFFRENGIPEIQNFDVTPPFRRQGVGSRLMDAIEELAFQKSDVIGIGVGLYAAYGAAQRMYIKRGYVPDGRGLMVHYEPVAAGRSVLVDDDLVLFLTKRRRSEDSGTGNCSGRHSAQ